MSSAHKGQARGLGGTKSDSRCMTWHLSLREACLSTNNAVHINWPAYSRKSTASNLNTYAPVTKCTGRSSRKSRLPVPYLQGEVLGRLALRSGQDHVYTLPGLRVLLELEQQLLSCNTLHTRAGTHAGGAGVTLSSIQCCSLMQTGLNIKTQHGTVWHTAWAAGTRPPSFPCSQCQGTVAEHGCAPRLVACHDAQQRSRTSECQERTCSPVPAPYIKATVVSRSGTSRGRLKSRRAIDGSTVGTAAAAGTVTILLCAS